MLLCGLVRNERMSPFSKDATAVPKDFTIRRSPEVLEPYRNASYAVYASAIYHGPAVRLFSPGLSISFLAQRRLQTSP
jgi:hypothetical protein